MTTTDTEPQVGTVNLLDVITGGRTLPDGYDGWAIRSVHPDLRSSNNYRYPFPPAVAEAPGPIVTTSSSACPRSVGDGICAAQTWQGMASGSIPASTLLLVAYRDTDILGGKFPQKVRLSRMMIVDVIDGARLVRKHGTSANLRYADLRSANLRYANLGYANLGYADLGSANLRYANLRSADLGYADLRYANLRYANLGYANLRYADLRYARGNSGTILPAGWRVNNSGLIVKD